MKAGAFLKAWPLGAGARIAASPDGNHVAFSVGDWVYTAVNGKVQGRVTNQPAYEPMYLPDGTLMYLQQTGMFGRYEPKYELFVVAPGGKPTRLSGTLGFAHTTALTKESVRAVVSDQPYVRTCVIDIALAAPHVVKQLLCLDGKQSLASAVASPNGQFFAIATYTGKHQPDQHTLRIQLIDAETRTIVFDREGEALVPAVSDDGTLVFDGGSKLTIVAGGKEGSVPLDEVSVRMFFRDARHLITMKADGVRLLEIPTLE